MTYMKEEQKALQHIRQGILTRDLELYDVMPHFKAMHVRLWGTCIYMFCRNITLCCNSFRWRP